VIKRRVILWTMFALITFGASINRSSVGESLRGTIVVAVPVMDGLIVCADKRLYNDQAGTYSDDNVKIRKISDRALFVATNTIGFYDSKSRTMAFNAFDVTEKFVATHNLSEGKLFWEGLKKEINARLREYFAKRSYAEWPPSDKASNNLLFNLIFYTTDGDRAYSHTLRVFYEKARTPVITIPDPIREEIRTTKLAGKGREVMQFISMTPMIANDPMIVRFGQGSLDRKSTTATDATAFARKLIRVTSTGVPRANVSPVADCAMLGQTGFRWIN
jgi:hypothetical protein